MKKRRQDRNKGVVPITVSGFDADGKSFQEVVQTLDMTHNGLRVGGIRRQLRIGDRVIVQHRHRKLEFQVVWFRQLTGTKEFQAGLQTTGVGDVWRV